jgi:hypothetical protein
MRIAGEDLRRMPSPVQHLLDGNPRMTHLETRGEWLARAYRKRRQWIPIHPPELSRLDRMDGLTERPTMPTSGERDHTVQREMTCRRAIIAHGIDTRCYWEGVTEVNITSDDWATWECGNGHTTQVKWED